MHLYEKRPLSGFRGLIVSLVVLAMIAGAFVYAVSRADEETKAEQESRLREAVRRALVTCYAAEGQYPPSIDYLQEEYALRIDEERYLVSYDAFASNIMPTVEIHRRGEDA